MNAKLIFSLSLLIVGAFNVGGNAATLIVDNDISHVAPEGSTIYRNAQEAHDAAATGDTLIFMGSSISYGPLILSKALKVIGPGYDLALNYPEKNTGLRSVVIERLSFDYNANTSSSGSDIQGIVINGRAEMQIAGLGGVHNVSFTSCKFITGLHINPITDLENQCNNWVIRKCYFAAGAEISMRNCNNWLIANTSFTAHYSLTISNSTIVNSVFHSRPDTNARVSIISSFLDLCIITDFNLGDNSFVDTNFSRCLSNINLPGESNLELPDFTEPNTAWFVGGASLNIDSDFALTNWEGFSDPVFGGKQPGIFGGSSPYRLSGLPNVPVILRTTGESTVVQGNNLVLEIEVELAE